MKMYIIIMFLSLFFTFSIDANEENVDIMDILENRTQSFLLISSKLKEISETLKQDREKEVLFCSFVIYKQSDDCKNGCQSKGKDNSKEYNLFLKVDELKKTNKAFSFDVAMDTIHNFFKDKYLFSQDVTKKNLIGVYRDRFYVAKNKESVDIWFFEFDVKAERLCLFSSGPRCILTLLVPYLPNGTIPLYLKESAYKTRL